MSLESELTVVTPPANPLKGKWPSVARNRVSRIRVRVVSVARRYRASCEAYERAYAGVELGTGTIDAWDEAAEAMDRARNALFSALDELDVEEGQP